MASSSLKVNTETRFTSLVLFHRYACHYFCDIKNKHKRRNSTDRHTHATDDGKSTIDYKNLGLIAASCIFLGCKAEEDSRVLRDVTNVAYMCGFHIFNKDTINASGYIIEQETDPPLLDEAYWLKKSTMVEKEQEVLRMLHFNVNVSHPYRAILALVDIIQLPNDLPEEKALRESWKILNDVSLSSSVLRHPCLLISCAVFYIVARSIKPSFNTSKFQTTTQGDKAVIIVDESGIDSDDAPSWWGCLGVVDLSHAVKDIDLAMDALRSTVVRVSPTRPKHIVQPQDS